MRQIRSTFLLISIAGHSFSHSSTFSTWLSLCVCFSFQIQSVRCRFCTLNSRNRTPAGQCAKFSLLSHKVPAILEDDQTSSSSEEDEEDEDGEEELEEREDHKQQGEKTPLDKKVKESQSDLGEK